VEKPQSAWALARLPELLRGLRFRLAGASGVTGTARIVSASASGEATATVRKGVKRTFFDLRVRAAWEGSLVDGEGRVRGTGDGELTLDDLDQDTAAPAAAPGYRLRWTAAEDGGKADAQLRAMLEAGASPAVHAAVAAFVAELRARG